jgi:3-hexulose-6-phosphate synthase
MMLLQLALDTLTIEQCIELLDQISDEVDIIEVGTPMIIEYGLEPVRIFAKRYPNCKILADVKIMDAGEYEAAKCFASGAHIVSVLGVSHNETINGVLRAALNSHGLVMVDLINVQDFVGRVVELDSMGVHYLCVHTAYDVQQSALDPFNELQVLMPLLKRAKSAVAGGLKLTNLNEALYLKPEIVVVGGGIINQSDPVLATKKIKAMLRGI